MKHRIPKDQLSILADKLLMYLEGIILGIGLGMFLALLFVPKDYRKVFPFPFYIVAWACSCFAPLIVPLANLLRRNISEWRSR